jgi:Outer membrane protein beta-barrel domain
MRQRAMPSFAAIACAALLCLGGGAQAAGSGARVGLALGPSSIDADCSSVIVTGCETDDTGMKLYASFDVSRISLGGLAFEVAYIDFGEAVVSVPLTQRTVEASAVAFDLALRGNLVPSLTAVGRLGMAYVSAKGTGTGGLLLTGSSSDSGLAPHLGLGLELALNRQFKVIGGFDFTDYDTGKESGSAHLFSVGVQMGF